MKRWWWVAVVAGLVVLVAVRWRTRREAPSLPAAFAGVMPRRVVWAWEMPEDLHALPVDVGVGYLAETLLVGERVGVMPRRQPLVTAPGAAVMAVVRVETRAGFVDSAELRADVAKRIVEVAGRDGLRALQVDFDATASEREFYAGVLRLVRAEMPKEMPLSMTALVSWCSERSWLRGLPVDEAVPMYFRMGGAREVSMSARRRYALREPLCRGSVGVSTDEVWPENFAALHAGMRVYIFAPKPWSDAQVAAVSSVSNASLARELGR